MEMNKSSGELRISLGKGTIFNRRVATKIRFHVHHLSFLGSIHTCDLLVLYELFAK